MRTEKIRMHKIRVGDVVKGHAGGWWRITAIHENHELIHLDAVRVDARSPLMGDISGRRDEWREVRR